MTREEAIKQLEGLQRYCVHNKYSDENGSSIWGEDAQALILAIAALREQEERSKGCEHCLSKINKDMMMAHGFAHCTDCGRRLEEV